MPFCRMRFRPLVLFLATTSMLRAGDALRPPAVPLVTCDPYFSIWSSTDNLADSDTTHWTGARQALSSLVRIDQVTYRLMGTRPASVPALPQVGLDVRPTTTIYQFEGAGVHLTLTFLTPLLAHNLEVFGRPVTYLTWRAAATDAKLHAVNIYFDTSAEAAVNTPDQAVVWSHEQSGTLHWMRAGSQAQAVLAKSGDNLRIDWGYLYLAVPNEPAVQDVTGDAEEIQLSFARTGTLPAADDTRMPRAVRDHTPALSVAFSLGAIGPNAVERHAMMAYDDLYSVELLHRRLRPYWRRHGDEAVDLLRKAESDYAALRAETQAFDRELMDDLTRLGGPRYASLGALTYREALAANKLAADADGEPLLFPKENFSDGSISTPDVIYPECPILLLFNPRLLKASLVPVFQYVTSGRWKFPFAPAQLGTYPLANGQTYGGGETSERNQQPVEETANMVIMTAVLAQMGQAGDLITKYSSVLAGWAQYLRAKGMDPDKQLCTDDFAGPLALNANLSLKAIEALGSYALLANAKGDDPGAAVYHHAATEYASGWIRKAQDGDHFRLAFDQPGTWSQKYNLVWDKLLNFGLFPEGVARQEIAYYKQRLAAFGFPLDNRHSYTKLDWEVWTASLAESQADFDALMKPVYEFVDRTSGRVPLTDWYDTADGKDIVYRNESGERISFRARPVVGGIFMKVLTDAPTWKKWSGKANGAAHAR